MEIKQLINQFAYRIEAKPEGGFIAHASDPSAPALEAPTRAELQEKIQTHISAALAAQFPGINFPLQTNGVKFAFHIEKGMDGSIVLHTNDGQQRPLGENLDPNSPILEKALEFIGKHLMTGMAQAMANQQGNKDLQIFVNGTTNFLPGKPATTADTGLLGPSTPIQSGLTRSQEALDPAANALFKPESSGLWPIIRFLIAALVLGAIVYVVRHH